jgi:tetratricopeptide (TPR) repeat protein
MEVQQHIIDQARQLGNGCFKAQKYEGECFYPKTLLSCQNCRHNVNTCGLAEAVKYYSDAVQLSPGDATLYRNRSAALSAIAKHKEALADAKTAVQIRPTWAKGFFR